MLSYTAIGIMSGTSLDGLDIVLCEFTYNKQWNFNILKSETFEYSKEWNKTLSNAPNLDGYNLFKLHKTYGQLIGEKANLFLQNINTKIDLIGSHGHTIFHQPEKKLTLQIGDGFEIASITGLTTISDFRSMDVALGGQGAPLVPIGDKLLFSDYDYCLNLGGFANISFEDNNERLAFDICPANIILNFLAGKSGQNYDKNGALGFLGKTNDELLERLNALAYYHKKHPKSLGKEWLDKIFIPIIESSKISVNDKLRTICEHIAQQISIAIKSADHSKTLITGGGAYNKLLIHLIKQKVKSELIIPDKNIIEFKEALIFAFLGVLRLENQINCLASVTGANKDTSAGIIYQS
ncbi:MAG TPA: anhydro-N-acetylmuramic acid kinase [Bacteroidales bacterium]|nr:anhydro-N-acetylmuramic acid kinase [Bacteroidales bacterium]